ncbi:MAG: hypothetical protein AB7Q45_24400, partial [Planctomycetaceae bacterium]
LTLEFIDQPEWTADQTAATDDYGSLVSSTGATPFNKPSQTTRSIARKEISDGNPSKSAPTV